MSCILTDLQTFEDDYLLKNGDIPDEVALAAAPVHLKKEIIELYSVMNILTGGEPDAYNAGTTYRICQYVRHDGLNYKSRIADNIGNTPFPGDVTNWELVTISAAGAGGGEIFYETYTATAAQTVFTTPFNMNGEPMIFVGGILWEDTRYVKDNNTQVTLDAVDEGEIVVITSGISIDTAVVIAKNEFTTTAGQTVFTCTFDLAEPSAFVNGSLQQPDTFSFNGTDLTFNEGITENTHVLISNGGIIGSDVYNITEVDTLLDDKTDKVYSHGSVGSVAFLQDTVSAHIAGDDASSNLVYSDANNKVGTSVTGTWRCLGESDIGIATIYLRIL